MDWFRFYAGTVYDRKLRRLPTAQRWLWVAVLTVASQSPEPGKLLLSERNDDETLHVTDGETEGNIIVTNDDLADIAKVDIGDVELGMRAFQRQRMLHIEDDVYVVTHWKKRQYISDSSTERVRRHRDKSKRSNSVSETPPETETDTDQEKRKRIYAVISEFAPYGISSNSEHDIFQFMDKGLEIDLLTIAFRKAKQNTTRDIGSYVAGILRNWLNEGTLTVQQYETSEARKQTIATGGERIGKNHSSGARHPEESPGAEVFIQQKIDRNRDRMPDLP